MRYQVRFSLLTLNNLSRFREIVPVSKSQKRDPRFDPLCGEFNDKLFKENYKFVNEYKAKDLLFLKKQIQEEEDPERRKAIKYLIQVGRELNDNDACYNIEFVCGLYILMTYLTL